MASTASRSAPAATIADFTEKLNAALKDAAIAPLRVYEICAEYEHYSHLWLSMSFEKFLRSKRVKWAEFLRWKTARGAGFSSEDIAVVGVDGAARIVQLCAGKKQARMLFNATRTLLKEKGWDIGAQHWAARRAIDEAAAAMGVKIPAETRNGRDTMRSTQLVAHLLRLLSQAARVPTTNGLKKHALEAEALRLALKHGYALDEDVQKIVAL